MNSDLSIRKPRLTGNILKWIGVVAMVLDHTAETAIGRILVMGGVQNLYDETVRAEFFAAYGGLYRLYFVLRYVGRVAFPLFAFLLTEGFLHTRNKKKYFLRLAVFAVITEIPYDLAFAGKVLETGQQNIFFTLGLGFVVLCSIEAVEKQAKRSFWMCRLGVALLSVAGCVLAVLGRVDFTAAGVGCIIAMYLMRERGYLWQAVAGCAVCTILSLTVSQLWCFLAVVPICFYDGSRGKQNKWLFYIIYPAHLLLLWAVCLRL